MNWVVETVASETKALERERRRFVREPSPEGLHRVRTGARRLRSLLEDVAAFENRPRLLRRIKRTARLTDAARDACVQKELLAKLLDETERDDAEPLLTALAERERAATFSARNKLRRMRFKKKARKA